MQVGCTSTVTIKLLVGVSVFLTFDVAHAAAPHIPPPSLLALVGEYRSPLGTITLYELEQKLVENSAGSSKALYKLDTATFTSASGDKLSIDWHSHPLSIQWNGVTFERFDLGTERVALIRAKVHANSQTLHSAALAAQPPAELSKQRSFDLVSLLGTIPNVKLDIRYATSDNFIGLPLYGSASAYLQRPAAEALAGVARSLAHQGLGLVIFDGYRPWFVTKMFWDAIPPEAHVFVADPSVGSKHNRGCAVDLSLYDLKSGRPIEMTGRYDEMSPRSFADYLGGTSRQRWFRDLLREEMQAHGFQVYPQEWWHFDFRDWDRYPIGNQAFENLSVTPKE